MVCIGKLGKYYVVYALYKNRRNNLSKMWRGGTGDFTANHKTEFAVKDQSSHSL